MSFNNNYENGMLVQLDDNSYGILLNHKSDLFLVPYSFSGETSFSNLVWKNKVVKVYKSKSGNFFKDFMSFSKDKSCLKSLYNSIWSKSNELKKALEKIDKKINNLERELTNAKSQRVDLLNLVMSIKD